MRADGTCDPSPGRGVDVDHARRRELRGRAGDAPTVEVEVVELQLVPGVGEGERLQRAALGTDRQGGDGPIEELLHTGRDFRVVAGNVRAEDVQALRGRSQ